jgi:hypothetical protein
VGGRLSGWLINLPSSTAGTEHTSPDDFEQRLNVVCAVAQDHEIVRVADDSPVSDPKR